MERRHPAAVAVETLAMVVLIRCPMLTEIMLKNSRMSQMTRFMTSDRQQRPHSPSRCGRWRSGRLGGVGNIPPPQAISRSIP